MTSQKSCSITICEYKSLNRHALTWNDYTTNKRITSITRRTWTDWIVINDLASCRLSTSWCAWISTFLIDTCTILWTFWTDNTFRSTIWWATDKIGQTWANFMLTHDTTLTIHSARARMAQFNYIVYFCIKNFNFSVFSFYVFFEDKKGKIPY